MKVKCESVMADGKAVFLIDKQKVFVPGVLLGEEVELVKNRRYELKKIYNKSPLRIDLKCNKFYECGGCQYLHVDYLEEQKIKNRYINNLFKDIYNKKIDINYLKNIYNYRNKVQVNFKETKKGNLTVGLYKEGTHDLLEVNDCLLHNEKANIVIKEVLNILSKYRLRAYDEKTRKGLLKHMLIRTSSYNNEVLLVLVLADKVLPKRKEIIKDIINLNLNITSIIENYNERNTSIILGDQEKVIYGSGSIVDTILGYKFLVSSATFFQINHEGVEILYQKAFDLLDLKKTDVLVDAYSGIGTVGICAAKSVKNVISIENNRKSVNNAITNAKINNIKNINFICNDATTKINEFVLSRTRIDALIMDPPRDGSTKEFIDAISKLKINKVCYISCEPTTLKRDLEIFVHNGYDIKNIECVDLFPRTFNVESICILERKS